jgi:hypothetical protein
MSIGRQETGKETEREEKEKGEVGMEIMIYEGI